MARQAVASLDVTVTQPMSLTRWVMLLCLLAAAISIYFLFHRTVRPTGASSSVKHTSDPTPPTQEEVHLTQVNLDRDAADTDIDIIAIHGLDTSSQDTWIWKDRQDPKKWINWLQPGMLSDSVDGVRIFTCDWPAGLFQSSDSVETSIDELAPLLLEGIHGALFQDEKKKEDRRIVFIASCLGGIILLKALVHANDNTNRYYPVRAATRGIVFLATPFRGTSFQDVAAWAELCVKARASIGNRKVSKLLNNVKASTFDLELLVRKFAQLCQDEEKPCEVFTFYEGKKTSLPLKVLPCLPSWLCQNQLLVNSSSATLDFVPNPLRLNRTHVLMNKFPGPEDSDYQTVVRKIRNMVIRVREGSLLAQADLFIRTEHYTEDKLQIERLSRERLPMKQCYINLTIVEQSNPDSHSSDRETQTSSPFSLLARQKIETRSQSVQIKLRSMFNRRKTKDGQTIQPRRILIRGAAGVGKTTLCKKIVYEFSQGTWREWTKYSTVSFGCHCEI